MAKFIRINESFSNIKEIIDCFYSFFILDEQLYSVHRRHLLFSYENWPETEKDVTSQIIYTTYKGKNYRNPVSEEILHSGNDPRVVSDGKKAYALSQGSLHSKTLYYLSRFPENETIELTLGKGVQLGKNWQPYIKGDALFIVDSISPFRINQIDIETGVVSLLREIPIDFTLAAMHDNYSILRGGSNALIHDKIVYGWGHATTRPYCHIPYIWELIGDQVTMSFLQIHSTFSEIGYSIVDPTSFFSWDEEHFALGVSCSQRDWFHPQWFLNGLLIFKKEDFFKRRIPKFSLETQQKSIFFHTTDLDSLIPSSHSNGGRINNGYKGCLVCGPSKEIDISKKWTIELCYSSSNKTSKYVGDFDILLNIEGKEQQVASRKIYGTKAETIRVQLSFENVSKVCKALIQTRVFTRKRTSVTAYFFELTNE